MACMQRYIRPGLVLACAAGTLLAVGCTEDVGNQIGSTVGSLLAQEVPHAGSFSGVAATVGGLIGGEIARYLNAQERVQAETAARESLKSNEVGAKSTRTWTSESNPGVSGGSTVLARKTAADGRQCRIQRNFINVKGKDVEQSETLCRDPNTGTWATATA